MPTDTDTRHESVSQGHLTGWSLSAGDEHCVYDANHSVIVNVQCGGMTGRRYDEATDIARLIVSAPKLLSQLEYAVKLLGAFPTINGMAQVQSMRETIAAARGGSA
jgi:hypothetical protein